VAGTVNGQTLARLTLKSGREVAHGSLRDGTYRLTMRADKIRNAVARFLDGDGDGTGGGNFVDEFFRLFGDTDGDVDALDKQVFQAAYAKRKRDAGYLWYFDANANGRVWAEDLALFQLGYC